MSRFGGVLRVCIFRFLAVLFILFWLAFFHTRGFLPYDEGWMLQDGLRLFRGDLIYKDFQTVYNPGVFYIIALSFRLLGISILSSRVFALINALISVFLIYLIGRKLKFGTFSHLFSISIYLFWGPTVINFVWPVMFCISTGLFVSYFFMRDEGSGDSFCSLFLTGVFSALTFIFKQNFGVAVFLTNIVFFLTVKKNRSFHSVVIYVFGYFLVIAVQVFYLIKTETLGWYLRELYYYTYVKIFMEGKYDSLLPWQFPGSIHIKILKILVYTLPFIVAVFAFIKIYKSGRRSLLHLPVLLGFYYLLSIRPTTDYVHLAPLIALAGLPLAVVYNLIRRSNIRFAVFGLAWILVFIGVHGAVFRNYYRWHFPITMQKYYSDHPRVGIFVGEEDRKSIEVLTNYFGQKSEEEILIYDFAPMFYLVLGKRNPTRYDFLHSGVLTQAVQDEVVDALVGKDIKYVLANVEVEQRKDDIAIFIKEKYEADLRINEYSVWKLRE